MPNEFQDQQNKIQIKRGDRAFLVGTTGSGKTTLARYLLAPQKFTVTLDPKWGWNSGSPRLTLYGPELISNDPKKIIRHTSEQPLVYQPSLTELKGGMPWFWDWIWWREETIVYVDEVLLCIRSHQTLPSGLARAIQQGRQKGISVWCGTQRPSRIPIPILSESEHHFVFRLRHPEDIKRMSQYTDQKILDYPPTGHDFWYYGDRDQTLFKSNVKRLNLGRV